MGIIEIHARQGGQDSELFAHELAQAISKHSGVEAVNNGRVIALHRL